MARIASGVDACCHRHVPYDVIKQTLVSVIRPLAGGKCRRFPWATERYRFHRYLCFHCIFCVLVFCILFCTNRVTLSYQKCIHSNSTLTSCFLSGFAEVLSTISEEKSKMSQPIRSQGRHLIFLIGLKNTNLVEDIEILLPVMFRWILFSV